MGFVPLGEEGMVSGPTLTPGLGQDDLCDPSQRLTTEGETSGDQEAMGQRLVLGQCTDLPLP